ncbi:hypothetical protein BGW42_004437 [Actinomortierella wolfii]|nr:hypothetical protein BGW42_004437 [Actinomortierella wolfii]
MADHQLRQFGHALKDAIIGLPRSAPLYVYNRFPILKWLPRYNPSWAIRDVIAGITVGLIVVPQGMSYSKLAGLPVQHGLYSAYIGAIFYCFMGTSKDLTIGPTAVISLITVALVNELKDQLTAQQVAAVSTLLVGAFTFALGFLRLGIILDFFPNTVLTGYTTGAAATILISQIPKMIGIQNVNNRDPPYTVIYNTFKNLPNARWLDAVFGVVAFVLLILIGLAVDRWGRGKFSIQMIKISRFCSVAILATIVSYLVHLNAPLDSKGQVIPKISILKTVPSGLPKPMMAPITWDLFSHIVPKLVAILLATILEHIAIGKAFARRNRYKIETNQELLALGAANVTASFFGAYCVTGSFSRSAVKVQCGVRTPFAGFVTGALVLLALFFLTPAFYWIPDASLCAVIIVAVSTLIAPPSVFIQYYRINLWDFLSSQISLWVTFFVSVEAGIGSGVVFSLIVLLFRVARPQLRNMRQLKDRPEVFVDESVGKNFDTVATPHGILAFKIEEAASFPNADYFREWVLDQVFKYTRFGGLRKATQERNWSDDQEKHIIRLRKEAHGENSNITDDDLPRLRAVIFDFSAVNNIDSTGLQGLFDIQENLQAYSGVEDYPDLFFEVHFVGIQSNVLHTLELSGMTRPINHIALSKVDVVVDDDSQNDLQSENQKRGIFQRLFSSSSKSKSSSDHGHSADIGHGPAPRRAGKVNALGSSPFLKEEGLVHLTIRDAIDAILVRQEIWEREHRGAGDSSGHLRRLSSSDESGSDSVKKHKADGHKTETELV